MLSSHYILIIMGFLAQEKASIKAYRSRIASKQHVHPPHFITHSILHSPAPVRSVMHIKSTAPKSGFTNAKGKIVHTITISSAPAESDTVKQTITHSSQHTSAPIGFNGSFNVNQIGTVKAGQGVPTVQHVPNNAAPATAGTGNIKYISPSGHVSYYYTSTRPTLVQLTGKSVVSGGESVPNNAVIVKNPAEANLSYTNPINGQTTYYATNNKQVLSQATKVVGAENQHLEQINKAQHQVEVNKFIKDNPIKFYGKGYYKLNGKAVYLNKPAYLNLLYENAISQGKTFNYNYLGKDITPTQASLLAQGDMFKIHGAGTYTINGVKLLNPTASEVNKAYELGKTISYSRIPITKIPTMPLKLTPIEGIAAVVKAATEGTKAYKINKALKVAYNNIETSPTYSYAGNLKGLTPKQFMAATTLTPQGSGKYKITTKGFGQSYTQNINLNPLVSSQSTLLNNIQKGLPTQQTGGVSSLQFAGQYNGNNIVIPSLHRSKQPSKQNTNNKQHSSQNQPFFLLNPKFYENIPQALYKTAGGLVHKIENWNSPVLNGGAPTVGGTFPNNYGITQQDINKLALKYPTLATGLENQFQKLKIAYGTALSHTMTNADYKYLGSPAYGGLSGKPTILGNPNFAAFMGTHELPEEMALLGGPAYIAAASPLAVAGYTTLGAGLGGTLNPALTYAFSGGKATPKQLANASAKGIIYGGITGATLPGITAASSSILPEATSIAGRVASGGMSNLGFINTYNLLERGKLASPEQDILAGALGAGLGAASPYLVEHIPLKLQDADLEKPFNYKGITFKNNPLVGLVKTPEGLKLQVGTPNFGEYLSTPHYDLEGNPLSPYPTNPSFISKELLNRKSTNLLLTPVGRKIFLNSLESAKNDLGVEYQYIKSADTVAHGLRTASLPTVNEFTLHLEKLNPEQNTALTDLVKNAVAKNEIQKVYGSTTINLQAPNFRLGKDLDVMFTNKEDGELFAKNLVEKLNGLPSDIKVAVDPKNPIAVIRVGGGHVIDGHTSEELPLETSSIDSFKNTPTPFGLKNTEAVNVENIPTQALSQSLKEKLGSSGSLRYITPQDIKDIPEQWRPYLEKLLAGKKSATTFTPSSWRIKDVIDSYNLAKIMNERNLNPLSRFMIDRNLNIFKEASEVKYGLSPADFDSQKVDLTSLIKGEVTPTEALDSAVSKLSYLSSPPPYTEKLPISYASSMPITPQQTLNDNYALQPPTLKNNFLYPTTSRYQSPITSVPSVSVPTTSVSPASSSSAYKPFSFSQASQSIQHSSSPESSSVSSSQLSPASESVSSSTSPQSISQQSSSPYQSISSSTSPAQSSSSYSSSPQSISSSLSSSSSNSSSLNSSGSSSTSSSNPPISSPPKKKLLPLITYLLLQKEAAIRNGTHTNVNAATPIYGSSVSSFLFPQLNRVAQQTYSPLLAGISLRPLPQTLDVAGVGKMSGREKMLENEINKQHINTYLHRSPKNILRLQALQKQQQQNRLADTERNYQDALYLNTILNALKGSGLTETEIRDMLNKQYTSINRPVYNTQQALIPLHTKSGERILKRKRAREYERLRVRMDRINKQRDRLNRRRGMDRFTQHNIPAKPKVIIRNIQQQYAPRQYKTPFIFNNPQILNRGGYRVRM